ncbi:MAG: hypothetical protein H0X31_13055 [Nostocaceae cyanobacterium]|nr:hypothetical protein [Nostocaceae cyanobacterium]
MMLPEEDRQALKKDGYKFTAKGVVPIAHPLQTHNSKSSSSEAQYRQGERDSINNPRPIQPKATPNLRGMSPDGAERWTSGSSPKPKPKPNLRGMSPDAAETWSAGSSLKPKPKPTLSPIAANTRLYGSADAEERRHAGSSPKPQLAIAPRGEQNNNNALNQASNVVKGTVVGNAVANRKLSPTKAKDVLKLVDKSGIGKADLEPRLKASGWIEVTGRWAKKSNPTSPIGSIWTNPARDESITIRPKKGGSFGVRGYDGPSGGAVNHLRQDPKNHKWKSQGRPGEGERPLIDEHPLDSRGRTGLKPGQIYDNAEKRTHFKLQPESRGVVKAFENSHVQGLARGASKVLAPVAAGLDTLRLINAYQKDGLGQEFRKEAGSVAGSWGGAAAGAAGGAAIGSVVPVVGTAAGAIVGGIIGGVAGSEFGDDIEQGAEKAGEAIADGAKKVWNNFFG